VTKKNDRSIDFSGVGVGRNKREMIYSYSSQDGEEDGILFDITQVEKSWENGLFNFVTTNLMHKGYIKDKVNIPNLLDLLNQSIGLVRKASKNFKEFDTFFSGMIELPDGSEQKVFICQNETGKFTIMLPEDY